MNAFAAWSQLYADLYTAPKEGLPSKVNDNISLILNNDDRILYERAKHLNAIIGGRVSVLRPDTRHVDYEIIPLNVADGCLYHCRFCCVKTAQAFQTRSRTDILEQIRKLKSFYGRNLENYNGLFLGNHDVVAAGAELICLAASEASKSFGWERPGKKTASLFLFGSVDSLLMSEDALKDQSRLPVFIYLIQRL